MKNVIPSAVEESLNLFELAFARDPSPAKRGQDDRED